MKITVNNSELAELEELLPESAKALVHVLGYAATAKLINRFGGVTLSAKSGAAKERSGGVHALLRDVLTAEEINTLIAYLGADQFYIPRCDIALRQLRNARFVAAVSERQATGISIRRAMAELCPQFGISDRVGWNLIRVSTNDAGDTGNQLGLFND
ncbi:mor transcription activator family protein [Aeromonas jandaei]|uniref:mor transcription activator family protein n=1 Tax=Aeromonas jandaei TaxID=650 RepID=UPI000CE22D77|nr:mor transcription activator family protein [Aeromonas jandaei]PPA30452.1 mor transcription activator family protein [Aeromonas jandaei]